MEILTLLKRVPDPEALIEIKEDGSAFRIEERYTLNFFDSLALEEAIRIKEKVGGKVTAITFGSSSSIEVLRTALAMGADEVILVEKETDWFDEFTTAKVLARVIETLPYDLILCGREAFDTSSGIVGSLVAKFLKLPSVTMVTKVEVFKDEKRIEVERDSGEGKERLSVDLPAVLTAQKGLNEPRVPSVMGMMKALKSPIRRIGLAEIGIEEKELRNFAKVEILKFMEVKKKRQKRFLKGDPEIVIKELIELLKTEAKVL